MVSLLFLFIIVASMSATEHVLKILAEQVKKVFTLGASTLSLYPLCYSWLTNIEGLLYILP